jgi:nitrite reductase (NO-forming)
VLQDDGTYRAEVVMRDMAFVPAEVTVPGGATLEIVVTNADGMPHDLVLDDGSATALLSRGEQAALTVVVADDVAGWCSVVGHREAGMVLDVRAG